MLLKLQTPKRSTHSSSQSVSQTPAAMSATAAARSILHSASRTVTAARVRVSSGPKLAFSPFRIAKQSPLSRRIFRSPVEMSCCVETMLPYHTATASALLNSMLSVSRCSYGWTAEGKRRTLQA